MASDVDTILLTDANTGCREAAVKAIGSSIPLMSSCKCDADALNVASAVKNVVIAFCRFLHSIASSMKLSLWHFLLSLLGRKPFKSIALECVFKSLVYRYHLFPSQHIYQEPNTEALRGKLYLAYLICRDYGKEHMSSREIPCRSEASQEVRCFSVLVAVDDVQVLLSLFSCKLTDGGFASACISNQQSWLCLLQAPEARV